MISRFQTKRNVFATQSLWKMGIVLSFLGCARTVTAQTFGLVPLDLGNGISVSGTVTTDGTHGPLSVNNFTSWNIAVTQVNNIVYTPANTRADLSLVSSTGDKIQVATSPDGVSDGGTLSFRGGRRFGVQVADFTGANVASGGQAFYVSGSSFGFLPLNRPDNTQHVAAHSAGGNVFNLTPLDFGSGVTLSGMITTDGAVGPLSATNLTDWNIRIHEVTSLADFTERNSRVLFSDLVSTNGRTLTVANAIPDLPGTPGGRLEFGTSRLEPFSVQLADFSDPSVAGGQADFASPFVFQVLSPLSFDANYVVATAVPEPGSLALLGSLGLTGAAFLRRRRAR